MGDGLLHMIVGCVEDFAKGGARVEIDSDRDQIVDMLIMSPPSISSVSSSSPTRWSPILIHSGSVRSMFRHQGGGGARTGIRMAVNDWGHAYALWCIECCRDRGPGESDRTHSSVGVLSEVMSYRDSGGISKTGRGRRCRELDSRQELPAGQYQ